MSNLFNEKALDKDPYKIYKLDQISKCAFGTLALGAVGDTLGFGSGHDPHPEMLNAWEFCGRSAYMAEIIESKFEGNYRNIKFRSDGKQVWVISDDSILHLMEAKAIVRLHQKYKKPSCIDIVSAIAQDQVPILHHQINVLGNERCFGQSTRKTYRLIKDDPIHWNHYIEFNPDATRCGGSMRGMVFGLAYPGPKNRLQLISTALNAGFLTNPSLYGALGTVTTAALTAFSLEDIPVSHWMEALLELFAETKSYLSDMQKQSEAHPKKYQELISACLNEEDWGKVFKIWNFYYGKISQGEKRIPELKELPASPKERDEFHAEIHEFITGTKQDLNRLTNGDRGDTSVMFGLHAFLRGVRILIDHFPEEYDSSAFCTPSNLRKLFQRLPEDKKERIFDSIIEFSVFHGGDSDSTGGIALALYGSVFGIDAVKQDHVFETEIMPEAVAVAKKIGKLTKKSLSK